METKPLMAPNEKRFFISVLSLLAIPPGGGMASAVQFLKNPALRRETSLKAREVVDSAITKVLNAPDNPFGDDREAISAAILKRVEELTPLRRPMGVILAKTNYRPAGDE